MTIANDIVTTLDPRSYAEIRPEIRTGDILLFSSKELFSHLIQFGTNSPWSHVGLVVRLEAIDRVMVLQAVTQGVGTVALSALIEGGGSHQKPYAGHLLLARHARFEALADAGRLREMSEFAVDRFGAPYNTGEILKIAARIVAGWLNQPMPRLLIADDEFICSEYAAECYRRVGIEIAWDGMGFIAPADFAADPEVSPVALIRTLG